MPRRKLENRTIEVILLQQDKHLWEKYQVVRVKPIFARNILFPQNIAVMADKANLNKYEQKMVAAQKEIAARAKDFDDLFMKIQGDDGLTFTRKINREENLYAQITIDDIIKEIKEKYKIDIQPHYFKIKKKIKSVGEYTVPFTFQENKQDIKVTVKGEKEIVKEEPKVEEETETTDNQKVEDKSE